MALTHNTIYSRLLYEPNRTVDAQHDCLDCKTRIEVMAAIEDDVLGSDAYSTYRGIEYRVIERLWFSDSRIDVIDVNLTTGHEDPFHVRVGFKSRPEPESLFCAEHLHIPLTLEELN